MIDELTSEQAVLLTLMAVVRGLGGRVIIPASELLAVTSFTPQATTTPTHDLIFEVHKMPPVGT